MAAFDRKQYNADRRERARARTTTEGLYFLPAETRSEALAEFVEWFESLSHGGGAGGGHDYGGARAQDIRQSAEAVLRRLQYLDYGAGDDLLFVNGEQADRCRDCLGGKRQTDAQGRLVRALCRAGCNGA
jgi:hypothetical protein